MHVSLEMTECDLKYIRQPPRELECNPYNSNNELSLECAVEASSTSDFSIVWFRRINSGGQVEELPNSLPRVRIDTDVSPIAGGVTQRSQSRITLTGLDEINDVGEYWCQVRFINNETLLQEKSSVLILYDEAHYEGLGQCSRSSFVDERACLHVQQGTDEPLVTDRSALTGSMPPAPFSEGSPTPDGMAEDLENSGNGKNLAALYAVVVVIAVFCVVIVALTIVIVVLYRKKCGPVRFKTEGE